MAYYKRSRLDACSLLLEKAGREADTTITTDYTRDDIEHDKVGCYVKALYVSPSDDRSRLLGRTACNARVVRTRQGQATTGITVRNTSLHRRRQDLHVQFVAFDRQSVLLSCRRQRKHAFGLCEDENNAGDKEKLDMADSQFNFVLNQQQHCVLALLGKACIHQQKGDYKNALFFYKKALKFKVTLHVNVS